MKSCFYSLVYEGFDGFIITGTRYAIAKVHEGNEEILMRISYHYQTDVVRLIKNYLLEHPLSEDTINGITHWWVTEQKFVDSKIAVDNALKILAVQGDICSIERNNETYYRLNSK